MWFVPPSKRYPLATATVLAVGQLVACVFFAALSLWLKDGLAAALAALCLAGSLWHTRQALTIRAAQRRGAVALPLVAAQRGAGADAPEAYEATLHRGTHARDGVLFVVHGVSAFVPTGPWRTQAVALARAFGAMGLRRVVMAQVPETVEALLHQVATRDGVLLGMWAWSPGRVLLKNPATNELISARMPSRAKERWTLEPWTQRQRSSATRIVAVVWALCGLCVAAGAVAFAISGQRDHLVAGIGYGAIFGIAAAVTHVSLRRQHLRK